MIGTEIDSKELPGNLGFMKKMYPGWHALATKALDKSLTANDIKRILGISYRKLNDWDEKGLLNSKRDSDAGWRKFSIVDLIWLSVIKEIKSQGIPVTKLQNWRELLSSHQSTLLKLVPSLVGGKDVFLATDFKHFWSITDDSSVFIPNDIKGKLVVGVPLKKLIRSIARKLKLDDFKISIQKDGSYKFEINEVPLNLESLKA